MKIEIRNVDPGYCPIGTPKRKNTKVNFALSLFPQIIDLFFFRRRSEIHLRMIVKYLSQWLMRRVRNGASEWNMAGAIPLALMKLRRQTVLPVSAHLHMHGKASTIHQRSTHSITLRIKGQGWSCLTVRGMRNGLSRSSVRCECGEMIGDYRL